MTMTLPRLRAPRHVAALLLAAMAAPVWAQPPGAGLGPTLAQPVPLPPPPASDSSSDAPPPITPATVPDNASVRPPAQIRSVGPAGRQPVGHGIDPATGQARDHADGSRQPKLYGPSGEPLPGMVPLGQGRVLDPATGRYYDSVPFGDGRKVLKND